MRSRWLPIRSIAACAVFTALIAVCAQIQLPLGMIPINLALFAVHLAGALLGAKRGLFCLAAYLLLGGVGVPVFANFSGGPGVFLGRTGGFLWGYLLCAVLVGLLSRKWGRSFGKLCAAMGLGTLVCYTAGTAWFLLITRLGLWASLGYCVLPFLPGDLLKILLAALLTRRLERPLAKNGLRFD